MRTHFIEFRTCLSSVFPLFLFLFVSQPISAQEQEQAARGSLEEPADAPQIRAQIALAEKLLGKTPDRGAVLYFLAVSHAQLRETLEALDNLKECIQLKEGFDPAGEPAFAGLKGDSGFDPLVEQAHRDFPAVTQAHSAFVTTEKDLIPEGLAYDPANDSFYLSSLNRRKIVKIPRQGKITDFVPGDRYSLLPVLGIRLDPSDGSVWSNSSTDDGKAELLHFDKSGALLGRFSLGKEGKHGFNDLVVTRREEIFLTDTTANLLYRFEMKTHEFKSIPLSRELLLPNGIALADDDQSLYVADQLGVLRLDLKTSESAEVDPGAHSTLAGVDGLYWHKGSLIAIQNGIGTPRIAAFLLSKNGLHVSKTTVLEYRSNFSVLPSTGAVTGDDFYFIANSQMDNLNNEHVMDATKLEPVRIGVLRLP
jgi:hypothetical protein